MRPLQRWLVGALAALAPGTVFGQVVTRQLVVERALTADSAEISVILLRRTIYRLELAGSGRPVVVPARPHGRAAYVVDVTSRSDTGLRFEIYPLEDGLHFIRIDSLAPGDAVVARLSRDITQTGYVEERRRRSESMGIAVAAGVHTRYRFHPNGLAEPGAGTDLEACILLERSDRMGSCWGVGRQTLPGSGYAAFWLFGEGRARVGTTSVLRRQADIGLAVRFSQAVSNGPRNIEPRLLSAAAYVRHHLGEADRRGWTLDWMLQLSRLGNAPETEYLNLLRLTAGLTWVP